MWAATDGGLLEFAEYAVKRVYTRETGLSSNEVLAVTENHAGGLWIGTGLGLDYLTNGSVYSYLTSLNGLAGTAVYDAVYDFEGNLWIGTTSGATRVALLWSEEPNALLRSVAIRRSLLFPDGEAYVATADGVLQRTSAGDWRRLSEGLVSPEVFALARSEDGELWVGTAAGMYRLANQRFFVGPSELAQRRTTSILFDRRRSMWVGTKDGLFRVAYSQDGGYYVETVSELEQKSVQALWKTAAGEIWVGTPNGAFRFTDGKWTQFLHTDGLADDFVYAGIEDSAGNIWLGTERGLSRMRNAAKADSQNTWTAFQVVGKSVYRSQKIHGNQEVSGSPPRVG